MENEKFLEALESANSLCRSAMEIARRDGRETNWEAFRKQLLKSLELQHSVMYPANDFKEVRPPGPHKPPPIAFTMKQMG